MNDYISRADAIQAINYEADKLEQNGAIPHGQGARAMAVVIEALPAADVVEVKRGKWIDLDSDQWNTDDIRCSNCGHYYTVDAERYCDIGFIKADLKFCPNCGAKMFEEES